jgi:hypothetical protein
MKREHVRFNVFDLMLFILTMQAFTICIVLYVPAIEFYNVVPFTSFYVLTWFGQQERIWA